VHRMHRLREEVPDGVYNGTEEETTCDRSNSLYQVRRL